MDYDWLRIAVRMWTNETQVMRYKTSTTFGCKIITDTMLDHFSSFGTTKIWFKDFVLNLYQNELVMFAISEKVTGKIRIWWNYLILLLPSITSVTKEHSIFTITSVAYLHTEKKTYFIFSNLLFKYIKHFQTKGKNQVHGIRTGLKLFYFTLTFFTIKAIFLSRNRVIHRFSSLNQTLKKNGFSRWCLEKSLPHKWLDLHIPLHPLLEFDLQP